MTEQSKQTSSTWRPLAHLQRYHPYFRAGRLVLAETVKRVVEPRRGDMVADFWVNGYVGIKEVFTPDEIERFREWVLDARDHQGDLLSHPRLRSVVLDDRILHIAQQLLGGIPVYFGDSGFTIGPLSQGYHKDNPDRDDGNAPDWKSRYTVLRFGVYLQDHSRHSGGLNVRRGSHHHVDPFEGQNVYLATSVGDVTAWNLRTSHSGNGILLKRFPWVAVEPHRINDIPPRLVESVERERIGIFFSFGLDDEHLKRDIEYLKTREYAVTVWKHSHYGPDVWDVVRTKKLIVRNIRPEIDGVSGLGLNKGHVQIPY